MLSCLLYVMFSYLSCSFGVMRWRLWPLLQTRQHAMWKLANPIETGMRERGGIGVLIFLSRKGGGGGSSFPLTNQKRKEKCSYSLQMPNRFSPFTISLQGKIEMLRRVDLRAVLKSDVTINLCKHRPLPRPSAALPRKKGSNTCFINVGSLQPGDSWVGTN